MTGRSHSAGAHSAALLIVTEGRKGSWNGRGRCAVERACASALHHRAAISTTRRGITASSVVYSVEERDDAEVETREGG